MTPKEFEKISRKEKRLTAYHEAGHAVAFYLFGEGLDYVTIIPDFENGTFGRCQPIDGGKFIPYFRFTEEASSVVDARLDFEQLVINNFAGPIAEVTYRNRRSKFGMRLHLFAAEKDLLKWTVEGLDTPLDVDGDFSNTGVLVKNFPALHVKEAFNESEQENYLQYLWSRTVTIIQSKEIWAAVDALARVLLEKGRITGKEAERVLRKHIEIRYPYIALHTPAELLERIHADDMERMPKMDSIQDNVEKLQFFRRLIVDTCRGAPIGLKTGIRV